MPLFSILRFVKPMFYMYIVLDVYYCFNIINHISGEWRWIPFAAFARFTLQTCILRAGIEDGATYYMREQLCTARVPAMVVSTVPRNLTILMMSFQLSFIRVKG